MESLARICQYTKNYKDVVINNLNKDPKAFDRSKACLVCGETGNNFNICAVLSNVSFLKKQYKSWELFPAKAH